MEGVSKGPLSIMLSATPYCNTEDLGVPESINQRECFSKTQATRCCPVLGMEPFDFRGPFPTSV